MPLYELDGHRVAVPDNGRFWVADTAVLVGRVVIGEDASVWFGTVARGDNEPIVIGARANVQDGCVLHTDPGFPLTIGPEASIQDAAATLLDHRVGCLPVLDDGKLVGIVTVSDVLRSVAHSAPALEPVPLGA